MNGMVSWKECYSSLLDDCRFGWLAEELGGWLMDGLAGYSVAGFHAEHQHEESSVEERRRLMDQSI